MEYQYIPSTECLSLTLSWQVEGLGRKLSENSIQFILYIGGCPMFVCLSYWGEGAIFNRRWGNWNRSSSFPEKSSRVRPIDNASLALDFIMECTLTERFWQSPEKDCYNLKYWLPICHNWKTSISFHTLPTSDIWIWVHYIKSHFGQED